MIDAEARANGTTREEAVRILAAERDSRVAACREELRKLLGKYDCSVVAYQELVNGMPKAPATIVVVPNA